MSNSRYDARVFASYPTYTITAEFMDPEEAKHFFLDVGRMPELICITMYEYGVCTNSWHKENDEPEKDGDVVTLYDGPISRP